jgi:hypothetical protein
MDSLASTLQGRFPVKTKRHGTNELWTLASKIANLLKNPTDTPEQIRNLTLRWLRNVKSNRWEIDRAYADLGEAANVRNKPAFFLYRFKEYKKIAQAEKKAA